MSLSYMAIFTVILDRWQLYSI